MRLRAACVVVGFFSFVLSLTAQTSGSGPKSAQVPPVIQFFKLATDEVGNPLSGSVAMTFSLYSKTRGGAPLWTEIRNHDPLRSDPRFQELLRRVGLAK